MLWLGLATSSWAIHRLSAKRNRDGKTPAERRPLALPASALNHRGIAVDLMDAFVGEVHRLMATQAPPKELAHNLSALLANYRSAAVCHLRELEPLTLGTNGPCEDGDLDALALMLIWGAQREVPRTDRQASRDEKQWRASF